MGGQTRLGALPPLTCSKGRRRVRDRARGRVRVGVGARVRVRVGVGDRARARVRFAPLDQHWRDALLADAVEVALGVG